MEPPNHPHESLSVVASPPRQLSKSSNSSGTRSMDDDGAASVAIAAPAEVPPPVVRSSSSSPPGIPLGALSGSAGATTPPSEPVAAAAANRRNQRKSASRKKKSSTLSGSGSNSNQHRNVDPDDDEEDSNCYHENAVHHSRTSRRRRRPPPHRRNQHHGAAVFVHRTKEAVWDSNELSIEAALCAVDHWESVYRTFRAVLVQAGMTLQTVYGTAEQSARSLEDGVWRPYRDWIVGPTFSGLERLGSSLAHCHNHPETRRVAQHVLTVTQQVPVLGPHVLAPTMVGTVTALQWTWQVVQYPIPSRDRVRHTVDAALTTLKWGLVQSVTAVQAYLHRVDASLTRIWCHTQWQVLGSGPYITLNTVNQQLVLDHLVERYFSMMTDTTTSTTLPKRNEENQDNAEEQQQQQQQQQNRGNMLARYEWAAHVRWHNPALYADWRERLLSLLSGSALQDEWWQPNPIYRNVAALLRWQVDEDENATTNNESPAQLKIGTPFLVPLSNNNPDGTGSSQQRTQYHDDDEDVYPTPKECTSSTACPGHYHTPTALWFVRPSSNSSSSPSGDSSSRWRILTNQKEQRILEERYQQIVQQQRIHVMQEHDSGVLWLEEDEEMLRDSPLRMGKNGRTRSNSNNIDDEDCEDCCVNNVDHVDVWPQKDDSSVMHSSASDNSESDKGDDDENDDEYGNEYPEPLDRMPTPPRRPQPPSFSSKQRSHNPSHTPSIAQWYTPTRHDILVAQQRYAISFFAICPKCRQRHSNHGTTSSRNRRPNHSSATNATDHSMEDLYGKDCDNCRHHDIHNDPTRQSDRTQSMPHLLPFPPPIAMVMRPTFWRFHGPGDEVRRAIWFLDTPGYGLQPFDEEAHAVLEDAYLFLQWMAYCRHHEIGRSTSTSDSSRHSNNPQQQEHAFSPKQPDVSDGNNLDGSLLTVEVNCPDGTARLVQFSSLTQATAIQKGLGAAIAIFKRRVYRGAWLINSGNPSSSSNSSPSSASVVDPDQAAPITMPSFSLDQAIAQAAEENGFLGETMVPNVSLRSLLQLPLTPQLHGSREVDMLLPSKMVDYDASLAVPPERLANEDMAKYLRDDNNDDSSKIGHLCLVVHGIGEMLRSIDVFGMSLQNLSDCCRSMRRNHAQVLDAHFAQMYPHANATVWAQCSTGRVEYLPVEWHESFSILTQRKAVVVSDEATIDPSCHRKSHHSENETSYNTVMMQDISLRTIPNMREFANDTLMDVLFFMSPEHHDIIIDLVTKEMNLVVEKFRRITGFHGSISVIGHSLGSVITWDILNQQSARLPTVATSPWLDNVPNYETSGLDRCSSSQNSEDYSNTPEVTTQSTLPSRSEGQLASCPQLAFCVDNFFLLGSPVPVFLMIRNQRQPLREDFYLRGCRRVFNIFHPYDPVAYRIEPCISPYNSEFEPTIVKHWNGGFRVQYRTRRLWRKLMETTAMTQRNVVEAFEQSMAGMGLLDAAVVAGDDDEDEDQLGDSDVTSAVSEPRFTQGGLVTGQLNQGRRIDYMLQEKEIESANEYVAALAAHSSYWMEKDLSLFIARQIYLSTLERSAAECEATEQSNWEALTPEDSLYSRS